MRDKIRNLKFIAGAAILAGGLAAVLAWAAAGAETAVAEPAVAKTVFVDKPIVGSITKPINEMHEKMAKDGWRFVDLEVHSENADTKGFWITYTKP